MVLSVVFSSISFLVFLVQLLAISKGQLFYFTGLCQAFAGASTTSKSDPLTLSVIAGVGDGQMCRDESRWSETCTSSPAGLTAFAACLIFTLHRKDILNDSRDLRKGHFGYCFVLAWICVPLLLVSAFLYAHLRKRQ